MKILLYQHFPDNRSARKAARKSYKHFRNQRWSIVEARKVIERAFF